MNKGKVSFKTVNERRKKIMNKKKIMPLTLAYMMALSMGFSTSIYAEEVPITETNEVEVSKGEEVLVPGEELVQEEVLVSENEETKQPSNTEEIIAEPTAQNIVEVTNSDGTTTGYADVNEALANLKDGDSIKLLTDAKVETWDIKTHLITQIKEFDGNGHTLEIDKVDSKGNGDYVFYKQNDLTVRNLKLILNDTKSKGFSLINGVIDNVEFIGGMYALALGNSDNEGITVSNSKFSNQGDQAIYFQENGNGKNVVIKNNTFDVNRVGILRSNEILREIQ